MAAPQPTFSRLPIAHLVSRRQWLGECAAALAGVALARAVASAQQLPPQFGVPATPPCDPSTKPTPSRAATGFSAEAPNRTRLAEPGEPGQSLVLTGAVIGLRCGLIAGATLDVWQADAKGAIDPAGTRLRGRQRTDAAGRYHVETIVPGSQPGRAPRLNVRITVPGKATLTTLLFLPEAAGGESNSRDREFDPLLAMVLVERTAARLTASFNIILDL